MQLPRLAFFFSVEIPSIQFRIESNYEIVRVYMFTWWFTLYQGHVSRERKKQVKCCFFFFFLSFKMFQSSQLVSEATVKLFIIILLYCNKKRTRGTPNHALKRLFFVLLFYIYNFFP
jgi:hypothetical protein